MNIELFGQIAIINAYKVCKIYIIDLFLSGIKLDAKVQIPMPYLIIPGTIYRFFRLPKFWNKKSLKCHEPFSNSFKRVDLFL